MRFFELENENMRYFGIFILILKLVVSFFLYKIEIGEEKKGLGELV